MAEKIAGAVSNIGGCSVTRYLPKRERRMVGPFIFFDHIGPARFPAGKGIDVKPHPHIGLATITYLFEGSILHRDSLGTLQEILPGEVNWMTAGTGIVHSERETEDVRHSEHYLHGVQTWVALPEKDAEIEPAFYHFKGRELPHIQNDDHLIRIIAGSAWDRTSPVTIHSKLFLADVIARQSSTLELPGGNAERAIFVVEGSVETAESRLRKGTFAVLEPEESELFVSRFSRLMIMGGEPFEKQPLINWNFVSFSREIIDAARDRWRNKAFPLVPGDETERVELPG
jgi:hypothetical protein